jgi:hypothetical protein
VKSIGDRIAEIAEAEVGNSPCGPNKIDGKPGYLSSCVNNHKAEAWCADFARWVWGKAGVLHASNLDARAASFGLYGPMHPKPHVGDAILFDEDTQAIHADHVAIVVKVFSDGNIASVGGNERTYEGVVAKDPQSAGGYSGAIAFSSYWGMKISGYVSPVEDDMPYSKQDIVGMVKSGVAEQLQAPGTRTEILNLVKKGVAEQLAAGPTRQEVLNLVKMGVAAELVTGVGASGVTPARGAEAAVSAQDALGAINTQLADLTALVRALQPATPVTTPAGGGNPDGAAPPAQG